MSILMSNIKVTKIVQKHFLWTFWRFLVTIICDVKIDISMCEPHYVNLFFLWTSSIVHVFDFLTSFWQLDIFLTTWHLFWHMSNGTHGWMGIMVNTEDRDGAPWEMGHMGDGAHWWWATWPMGHMGNGTHGQRGIVINTEYRDGVPWGMGHMGDGAMGHMVNVVMCRIMCNFLNTAWIFIKFLLHTDIDVFYPNIQWYFHNGLF